MSEQAAQCKTGCGKLVGVVCFLLGGAIGLVAGVFVAPMFDKAPDFKTPKASTHVSGETSRHTDEMMSQVRGDLALFASQIEAMRTETGMLPLSAEAFAESLVLMDAWDNEIQYEVTEGGTAFVLTSPGPDGEFGNADDMIHEVPSPE